MEIVKVDFRNCSRRQVGYPTKRRLRLGPSRSRMQDGLPLSDAGVPVPEDAACEAGRVVVGARAPNSPGRRKSIPRSDHLPVTVVVSRRVPAGQARRRDGLPCSNNASSNQGPWFGASV